MFPLHSRVQDKVGLSIDAIMQDRPWNPSDGAEPVRTLDRLRGWIADEALAAAWYIFARHPHDPRRVILTGANTPGDSDSIAGALAGAHRGVDALPAPWVQDLERTDELRRLAESI